MNLLRCHWRLVVGAFVLWLALYVWLGFAGLIASWAGYLYAIVVVDRLEQARVK